MSDEKVLPVEVNLVEDDEVAPDSILMCMRVSDGPSYVASTTAACIGCGEQVHVSDVNTAMLARGVKPMCMQCVVKDPGWTEGVKVTRKTVREAASVLGKELLNEKMDGPVH